MLTEVLKRQCPVCGFPLATNSTIRWQSNGTITMTTRKDFRGVVLRQSQIEALVKHINEKLGVSIEHVIFEAQRNAARTVFDNTFDKIPGARRLLKINAIKRRGVEFFNLVAVACGMCFSETLEYIPGKLGIARMTNPFYMPMMAACVVGAFECLEGMPFDSSWEETSPDTYVLTVVPAKEKPDVSVRLEVGVDKLLPGNKKLDKCPKCHAPRALAHWDWDLDAGTITDPRTGARMVILDGHGINAVFRELITELGEEVQQVLVDVQRDWTVQHLDQLGLSSPDRALSGEELEKVYRDYLSTILFDGLGNPVFFKMADGMIEVTVENPYNVFILAGTFQGLYEALEKTGSKVEWAALRPGAIHFTVSAA